MDKEQKVYTEIGNSLKDAVESQMFGKPCFKIGGKAYISFFEKCMVFKLNDKTHEEALRLKGSKLFDPSGKKRPMKEWVQVTYEHADKWKKFAKSAYDYVSSLK